MSDKNQTPSKKNQDKTVLDYFQNKKKKAKVTSKNVSLSDVCTEGFDEHSDNTVLKFIILNIKKVHQKSVKTFSSGHVSKWNVSTSLAYDRIITAADIGFPTGSCFCIIYQSQRESDNKLQKFKLESCGVGDVGEMIEPSYTGRNLGNSDVPILQHKWPLKPIRESFTLLTTIPNMIYDEENLPNSGTRFFLMKGVLIHVQNVSMEIPICTGTMCDRQEIRSTSDQSCACLTVSNRCPVVLSCNLFVKDQDGRNILVVKEFRSWVFTKMICGSLLSDNSGKDDFNDGDNLDQLRERTSIILDYVNSNGGWTVIGWYRVGMQQDAADKMQDFGKGQVETVAAETVMPHVSRLVSTFVEKDELVQFRLQASAVPKVSEILESHNRHVSPSSLIICGNCFRQDIDGNIGVHDRLCHEYNFRKKLCSIHRTCSSIQLCDACHMMLLKSTKENHWSFIWPSYFWKLFSLNLVANIQVSIWKWIPKEWRKFWMYSLQNFPFLSVEEPLPYFTDVSEIVSQLEDDLKEMSLIKLRDALNRHPYTSVKCPWGCDEFLETCCYLPFYPLLELFMKREFPTVKIPLCETSITYGNRKKIKAKNVFCGIRPDYLSKIFFMLDNPAWPILPSIRVTSKEGPMIMVCSKHAKGSKLQYVHVPVNPIHGNLPSIISPQLSHATLNARTIRPLKLNKYSNTYQLVRAEGSYRGVDSCYLLQNEDYSNEMSPVAIDDEKLFLQQRTDMRSHLRYLQLSEQIPPYIAREKLYNTSTNILNIQHSHEGLEGATYITLYDTLSMETEVQQDDRNSHQSVLPWSRTFCRSYSSYQSFRDVPMQMLKMKTGKDYRLMWILGSLLLNNNILWHCFDHYASSTSVEIWTGWILKYLFERYGSMQYKKVHRRYTLNKTIPQLMWILEMTWNNTVLFPSTTWLNTSYSPTFSWNQLYFLFSLVYGVNVFQVQRMDDLYLTIMQSTSIPSVKILAFFVTSLSSNVKNTVRNLPYYSEGFELTNIVYTDEDSMRLTSLNVTIWIRRMYVDSFEDFWVMTNQNLPSRGTTPDVSQFKKPFIIIYSRRPDLSLIQRNYLMGMGNLSNMICPVHNKHVISTPYLCGKQCCFRLSLLKKCHCVAAYQCPFKDCSFYLCKKHQQIETPNDDMFLLDQNPTIPTSSFIPNNVTERSVYNEEEIYSSDVCDETEILPDCLINDAVSDVDSIVSKEDIDAEQEIAYFSSVNRHDDTIDTDPPFFNSNMGERMDIIYLPSVNNDNFLTEDNVVRDENITQDESLFKDTILPTSLSSSIKSVVSNSSKSSIPLSILLNHHLRVLIRRNHPLKANRKMRNFLERIVANTDGDTVELIYPEGMIFPNIFFNQRSDGSIDGCIPSPLWTSGYTTKHFGFASIEDHMRNRIMNSSLRCSTEPTYLFFAFDTICNANSPKIHSQIILSRGFEHMLGSLGIYGFPEESTNIFSGIDTVNSQKTVLQLAAFLRDNDPTYFYTHTCNTREHFGVAPLQRWVDLQIEQLRFSLESSCISDAQFKKQVEAYNQRLVVPITRSWYRAGKYYINYICASHERPLGPIKAYWGRWEDNKDAAALSHLHLILSSYENKSKERDLNRIQNRIICSSKKAIDESVIQPLIDEGLLSASSQDMEKYYKYVKLIQDHGDCRVRNYRCHRQTGKHLYETQCRVPNYGKDNPNPNMHSYACINANHNDDAKEILFNCGLLLRSTSEEHYSTPLLQGGKYYYPAEQDEHLIPFNARLFVSHYSSDCLEICDRKMSSSYLATYNALIDKSSETTLRSIRDKNEIEIRSQNLYNTKVSTGSFLQRERKKELQQQQYSTIYGRQLGLPQAIGIMLQEPQIFTNAEFITIPTCPLEQRAGLFIKPSYVRNSPSIFSNRYNPLSVGRVSFGVERRRQLEFPIDRQFTFEEQMIISDMLVCPDTIDRITKFSIRPPELRFITNLSLYHQCFISYKPNSEHLLQQNFFTSAWVDGLGYQIMLRYSGILPILQLFECPEQMKLLLYILRYDIVDVEFTFSQRQRMRTLFLHPDHLQLQPLPIIVFKPVKPNQTNRFLIHLLLSLGTYSNELQLFSCSNIVESFQRAQLLTIENLQNSPTIQDVFHITRRYILEQLLYIPGGTKTFDRYLIMAYHCIKTALLESSIMSFDMPSYFYSSLVTSTNDQILQYQRQLKENLINTLTMEPSAPSKEMLLNASKMHPLSWQPNIRQISNQSDASYAEHVRVCQILIQAINHYQHASSSVPMSIFIIGGPGTGKTYQLKQSILYSLSQGLHTVVTSLMSERAIILGSRHLHYLLSLAGTDYQSVHAATDAIIIALHRKPHLLYLWQTADELCIDEIGNLSAEMLNTIDNVLRRIRNKGTFFGGLMLRATMDILQLPPITGRPCLTSSLIITSVQLLELQHYVRSRTDPSLQRIITLSRSVEPLTPSEREEFLFLIENKCTHVERWNDLQITADVLRILGTKQGMKSTENMYYNTLREQNVPIVHKSCEDTQQLKSSHNIWKTATDSVIRSLNRNTREPEELLLHDKMVVELTFNNGVEWSNGQMGYLTQAPPQTSLDNWESIPILLAPPGVRILPSTSISQESLTALGWKLVHVRTAPEIVHHCYGGMFGKRRQYGLRPRIAMTIHKAMGGDFGKIASSVCDDGINGFRLWERGQVIVLLSRVHTSKDLIFVGDKTLTSRTLLEILSLPSPYDSHLQYISKHLTNPSSYDMPSIINLTKPTPVQLCSLECPKQGDAQYGYVYLLISLSQPTVTYIGETINLFERINQHNKGWSQRFTNSIHLRPWACMAYVVGFTTHYQRKYFESLWQYLKERSSHNVISTPIEVLHIGQLAISSYHQEFSETSIKLRLVQFIDFTTPSS